jgi:hypothetical protein
MPICETCGDDTETRPYGEDGEDICFDCMTATEESRATAREIFKARVEGILEEVVANGEAGVVVVFDKDGPKVLRETLH